MGIPLCVFLHDKRSFQLLELKLCCKEPATSFPGECVSVQSLVNYSITSTGFRLCVVAFSQGGGVHLLARAVLSRRAPVRPLLEGDVHPRERRDDHHAGDVLLYCVYC